MAENLTEKRNGYNIISKGIVMRADYKRKNRAVRILLIVLVWMGLTHFVIGIAYIPTESMEPSIGNKSLIIEYRLPYIIPKYCRVERGDIISFTHEGFRNTMCKRVIGLPGEMDIGYTCSIIQYHKMPPNP